MNNTELNSVQQENQALRAKIAELEEKLKESQGFARWLEREWEKERHSFQRVAQARYHQIKALGGVPE